MKKTNNFLLLTGVCFFLSTALSAQANWGIGSFKVTKFDVSVGIESDQVNDLDYNYYVDKVISRTTHCPVESMPLNPIEQEAQLNSLNFANSTMISNRSTNPSFNAGITMQSEKFPFLEWRNAISIKPRTEELSYQNNSAYGGDYLNIRSSHTELAVESALLFRLQVSSFFNLYLGAGTNLGVTHFDETCVTTAQSSTDDAFSFRANNNTGTLPFDGPMTSEGFSECYVTDPLLIQRAFAQLGAGFIVFDRVELGFDVRYGAGLRTDFITPLNSSTLIATNFNLSYILK